MRHLNGHGAPLSQVWTCCMRAVTHTCQAALKPGLASLHLPAACWGFFTRYQDTDPLKGSEQGLELPE